MRRKVAKLFLVVATVVIATVAFFGCSNENQKSIKKSIESFTFWGNKLNEAIPQTAIHDIVKAHLDEEKVEGYAGKEKKVAILGFDGARADSLVNVITSGGMFDKDTDYSGVQNGDMRFSGINSIRKDGGVYISYAGGEKGKSNQQHTSTAPGWAAILTGVWGEQNGITNNGQFKNTDYKSIVLKASEEYGKRSTFGGSWSEHFDKTYLAEMKYASEKSLNAKYEYMKNRTTVESEIYDEKLQEYLLNCVTEGHSEERDVIFGIYEAPDYNGHDTKFTNENNKYANAVRNTDNKAYEVIEKIKARANYDNEDWLIILTSDHGGTQTWHGNQTIMERTTFIASNKKIDSKYFGVDYDGYKQKSYKVN